MPQPIDLQTELARTNTVERIQQIADRVSLVAQQRTAVEADEERLRQEQQIQQTPETENPEVDADGHRKNPTVGRRRRRKRDQSDADKSAKTVYNATEETEAAGDTEGSKLDVSI